jgi:glucokinase
VELDELLRRVCRRCIVAIIKGFPKTRHVIGVDLGGSNVRALLTDASKRTVVERTDGRVDGDARTVVAQLVGLCRKVADDGGVAWSAIAAAGVGVPGVAHGDALRLAPNLPSFDGVDLRRALFDELGIDVAVDNDVNVATLAEARHGVAAGVADFVFIAVGTGIGMGIVAGGRLLHGATGAAGEIGGLPLGSDPFDPVNQLHGPLEEVAGGVGVARRYAERAGLAPQTVTAREVFAAAAAGDAAAAFVVDEQARAVALGVVAVQSVLDPELVVFGGGIGSRGELLERVRSYVTRLTARPPVLAASALGERAGAIGAAELGWERAAGGADG